MAIKLTKTEQELSIHAMFGYSVKQLADLFDVTESQIKRHLGNIYQKRGVTNRIELMAKEILRLTNEIRLMEMERDER
jgi:DNA-binding CsgD family transcriptional regulator